MSTGDPEPLRHFSARVKGDPLSVANHYMLVLWGHTFGLGFGRDHNQPLTIRELRGALAESDVLGSTFSGQTLVP